MTNALLKGFKNYLKLERSLSDNSIDAYLNDAGKLYQRLESNQQKVDPINLQLDDLASLMQTERLLEQKIDRIIKEMKLD